MHELSVTQHLLDIALRQADCREGEIISDLYLVVGDLSSIVDESVQFYWSIISAGTPAEQARLHFRRVPAVMQCRACHQEFSPHESLPCPGCGSVDVFVRSGEEFYLEALDIQEEKEFAEVKVW